MADRSGHWSQLNERGSLLALTLVLWLYRCGGRWLCQAILPLIIGWYWLFARRARAHSLAYLHRLHHSDPAQSPFSRAPTAVDSYRHFLSFGESLLDKMEAWLGRIDESKLQLHGHEHFRAHYQRGLLIAVSHFGNVEFLRAIRASHQQKINVLVYQRHASQFNKFLKLLNPAADVRLLPVDELGLTTAVLLEQKLAAGEWVIIAADRIPVASDRVTPLPFLGAIAPWPQGAWLLASLLKAPICAVFCYRQRDHFSVHIHLLSERLILPRQRREQALQQIVAEYIQLLEQHCRRAPLQWFNFYSFWKESA